MKSTLPDYYATLGLHRRCTAAQIRDAYRILAKQHHPDLNPGCANSLAHTQLLNAAYEVLGDPARRKDYDDNLAASEKSPKPARAARATQNIAQDASLRLADLFRGTTLEVRVHDPGNPAGTETYRLEIPPMTAPGAKFRVARTGAQGGGHVTVRIRAQADFRFKTRGSDLRCDLRLNHQRAAQGGEELVHGPTGNRVRVKIPARVARGEVLRVSGEGLPKARGGRGDLLVRIMYQPVVKISRASVSR